MKTMQKLIAVMLMICMSVSLASPAFAAEGTGSAYSQSNVIEVQARSEQTENNIFTHDYDVNQPGVSVSAEDGGNASVIINGSMDAIYEAEKAEATVSYTYNGEKETVAEATITDNVSADTHPSGGNRTVIAVDAKAVTNNEQSATANATVTEGNVSATDSDDTGSYVIGAKSEATSNGEGDATATITVKEGDVSVQAGSKGGYGDDESYRAQGAVAEANTTDAGDATATTSVGGEVNVASKGESDAAGVIAKATSEDTGNAEASVTAGEGISVEADDTNATGMVVSAENTDEGDATASGSTDGNVSVKTEYAGTGLDVSAHSSGTGNATATAEVSGDVDVITDDYSTGIYVKAVADGKAESSATVGGKVTAESEILSTGIDVYVFTVEGEGDAVGAVTVNNANDAASEDNGESVAVFSKAEGDYHPDATAVNVKIEGKGGTGNAKAEVAITEGDVVAKAIGENSEATGIELNVFQSDEAQGNANAAATITEGDIKATATGDNSVAAGIIAFVADIDPENGDTSAKITLENGNITAEAENAAGIYTVVSGGKMEINAEGTVSAEGESQVGGITTYDPTGEQQEVYGVENGTLIINADGVKATITGENDNSYAFGTALDVLNDGEITVTIGEEGVTATDATSAIGTYIGAIGGKATQTVGKGGITAIGNDSLSYYGSESIGSALFASNNGTIQMKVGEDGITAQNGMITTGVNIINDGGIIGLSSTGGIYASTNKEDANVTGLQVESTYPSHVIVKADSVTSEGPDAAIVKGISITAVDESTVAIEIDENGITATDGKEEIVGVEAKAEGKSEIIVVTEDGDIQAVSEAEAAIVRGIVAAAYDANSVVTIVAKNIEVHGDDAVGAELTANRGGSINLEVGEDISGDDAAIELTTAYESDGTFNAEFDVLVEGTIHSGDKASVILNTNGMDKTVTLTAWQIELNDNGNIAGETAEAYHSATAENFEKNINYIIKIEQPEVGGVISATNEQGEALEQSHDWSVAKMGEKVLMKIEVADGYRVTGAYNGKTDKVPLIQDANGDYYVVVEKNNGKIGGVYLTAEFEQVIQEPDQNQQEQNNQQQEQNQQEQNNQQQEQNQQEQNNQQQEQNQQSEEKEEKNTVPVKRVSSVASSLVTVNDVDNKAQITFYDNALFMFMLDGKAEYGMFKLDDGKIIIVTADGTMIIIDEDGSFTYVSSDGSDYQFELNEKELETLMNALAI